MWLNCLWGRENKLSDTGKANMLAALEGRVGRVQL